MPFGHLAAMSRGSLRDEVSCSICLQLFQDPVSIHCGHSFCRSCITRCWEGRATNFSCPRCRQTAPSRSLRPNWELAGVVEATKVSARRPAGMAGAGENLCQEHQEALKLFCEDEQRLICIICNTSRVHRKHSVVPVAEAAQEYRERIQHQLQRLRQEREALRSSRKRQEDQAQDHARRGQAEKQKFMTQYKELHKFLERDRAITVARMEQLDVEATTAHKKILDGLSEETTRLDTLIKELERLGQRPDWEVLKDIKPTLSRCQQRPIPQPPDVSLELEEEFKQLEVQNTELEKIVEKIRDSVEFHISLSAQVTLDPRTAHAKLLVANDLSSVRQATAAQDVPSTPERFLSPPCVLGLRGFSSGRHYWEVEVTGQGSWAVGVARASVPRDRCLPVMVNRDVWALCHCTGADKVLNLPKIDNFDLEVPQKLRVVLDLQEGRVVFFDANTEKRLYTFQEASFRGETIYPWFMVEGNIRLQLC